MKNVRADYLIERRSLQMEKEKLNAAIVEGMSSGVYRVRHLKIVVVCYSCI